MYLKTHFFHNFLLLEGEYLVHGVKSDCQKLCSCLKSCFLFVQPLQSVKRLGYTYSKWYTMYINSFIISVLAWLQWKEHSKGPCSWFTVRSLQSILFILPLPQQLHLIAPSLPSLVQAGRCNFWGFAVLQTVSQKLVPFGWKNKHFHPHHKKKKSDYEVL